MKYQVKIGERVIGIKKNSNGSLIDEKCSPYNIEKQGDRYFIYTETGVATAWVVGKQGDEMTLNINGKVVRVSVKDHIALMLEKLGIDNSMESIINELKAPMPGVIMSIVVKEGQEIKKGDPLLILEAMKMENMIKSPRDGIVTFITIEKGQSVEKNETLMSFS